jgi:heme oxygenase
MLTFKKNIAHQQFTAILDKANKEPIGIIEHTEISNVIISYEVYQKLSYNYAKVLQMLSLTDEDLEKYLKSEEQDEILSRQDMIG